MESVVDGNGGGSRMVMTELSRIKELVKHLDVHLGDCPDLCKHLAAQIFTVTEKSIGMIRSRHFDSRKRSAADAGIDSPPFPPTPSPLVKANKKRKMMAKGKVQVRVSSSGGGAETAPEDDGYSWRKYGQKEILGAQHPRAYYRCRYRKTQECSAIKQVQRADDDPTFFDVIYHGTHTCVHKTDGAGKLQPATPNPDAPARSLLQSLSSGLTENTEGLTCGPQQGWSSTTPFSFSPAVNVLTPPEHKPSFTPSTLVNCFEQGVWLSPSQHGLSPATSDSSYIAPMNPLEAEWRAESELQQIVSALALVAATSMPEPPVELEDFDVSIFLL